MVELKRKLTEADIAHIFGDAYPEQWESLLRNCACPSCGKESGATIVEYSARMNARQDIILDGKCATCANPIQLRVPNYNSRERCIPALETMEKVQRQELEAREYVHFPENTVFYFDIVLSKTYPWISRKVVVPADATFHQLHYVIQFAMGWKHCHLHQFIINDDLFLSIPDPDDWTAKEDTRKHQLQEFFQEVGDSLVYEYDFGDSWRHEIKLKKIGKAKRDHAYPRLESGKGTCPPEDIGGIYGYRDWLKAHRNPRHPMHYDAQQMFGRFFDPTRFDYGMVTFRLFLDFQKNMKAWDKKAGWPPPEK